MPTFPIIDSHLHIWDPALLPYAWLDTHATLGKPFLLEQYDLACAANTIDGMVFVECDIDSGFAVKEVEWVSHIAARGTRIKAIVAHAPLDHGTNAIASLEKLATYPLVRGVRRLIQSEPDADFCTTPAFIEGVRLLERFGWSFDICITYRQMESAIRLVDMCPNVQFILDHLGKPNIRDGELQPWRDQMKQLAERPNIVCKLSGAATEADHKTWAEADLHPFIMTAVDTFGPQRLMFGSDWPVATQAINYGDWIAVIDHALAGLSHTDLRSIYYDTAKRIYKL